MSSLQARKKRVFLLSNLKEIERRKISNMIHALGGTVTELTDDFKATHLVAPYFNITPKMVAALAAGIWIVHTSYVLRSYKKRSWDLELSCEIGSPTCPITNYEDMPPALTLWESAPRLCREKALIKGKPNLTGWKVGLITDEPMQLHALKSILKAGGASVLILKPPFNQKTGEIDPIDFVVVSVSDKSSVAPSLYENIPCVTSHFITESLCMDPPPDISKYDFRRCEKKEQFDFKISSNGKTPTYDLNEGVKGNGGRLGRTPSTGKNDSTKDMCLNRRDNFNISINTPIGYSSSHSDLLLNLNISTNCDHGEHFDKCEKKTMNSINLSLSKICADKESGTYYGSTLSDTINFDTLDQRSMKREPEFQESPSRKRTASSRLISPGKRKKNLPTQTNTLLNYFSSHSNDKCRSGQFNNFASKDLCVKESENRAFKRKDKSLPLEEIILSSDEESNVYSKTFSKSDSVAPHMFSDCSDTSRLHQENVPDHHEISSKKDCVKLKFVNDVGLQRETRVIPEIIILSDEEENDQVDSEYKVVDLCTDEEISGEVLVEELPVWEEDDSGINEGQDDHLKPTPKGLYSDELDYIPSKPYERKSAFNSINETDDTFDSDEELDDQDDCSSKSSKEEDSPCTEDVSILYEAKVNKRTDPEDIDRLSDSELPLPPCIPHIELSADNTLPVPLVEYLSPSSLVKHMSHSFPQKDMPPTHQDSPPSSPPGSPLKSFGNMSHLEDFPCRPALKGLSTMSSLNNLPVTSSSNVQLNWHKKVQNTLKNTNNLEKYNFCEEENIIFESANENRKNNSPLFSSCSKSVNFVASEDSDSNFTVKSSEVDLTFDTVSDNTIPLSDVNSKSFNSLFGGTEPQDFILNKNSVCSEVNKKVYHLEKDTVDNVIQHTSSSDTGSKSSKSSVVLTAEKICKTQADCYLSKLHSPWIEMGAYSISQCIVRGPADCNLQHGKKRTSLELEHFDENFLLEAVCPSSAIELLQGRIDFGIYPSYCLVQHALLCTMDRWNEIGIDALLCLQNLLQMHPPCAVGMLDYYKKIFFSPVTEMNAGATDGVFWYCLTKLEEALNFSEGQLRNNGLDQSPIREEFLDSIIFPAVNRTYRDSVGLLNSEKLDQLFNCLEYFNDVMEADLSVGLLKNLSNPKRYVCKNGKPLMAVAVWGRNAVGSVNMKCKQIMKLFLDCYKKCCNKMYSLSFNRLMCSMAQVVYMSERNSTPPRYPNIGTNCRDLANIFSSLIMEYDLNMVEVSTLLRSLRPDWFRLCVCCSLIEKLNGRNIEIALQPMVALLKDLKTVNQEYPSREIASNLSLLQVDEESVLTENTSEVSQLLLKKAMKKDKKGETRLHITCRCNRFTEVEELLKVPNINVNERDNAGFTPLHEASLHGSIECVKLLLNHHTPSGGPAVDPRAKTSDGVTPLMDAVKRNHLEVASMLLEYGGQDLLLDRDIKGNSAWDYAFTNEMKSIFMKASETSKCSALSTVPMTLRIKLVTLVPDMILFYLKFSEVRRISNELQKNNSDECVMNGLLSVKFSPLQYKQDYNDYKTLRGVVKQILHSKINLVDRLIFVL